MRHVSPHPNPLHLGNDSKGLWLERLIVVSFGGPSQRGEGTGPFSPPGRGEGFLSDDDGDDENEGEEGFDEDAAPDPAADGGGGAAKEEAG